MENNTQQNNEQQKVEAKPFEPNHNKNVGMAIVAYILFFIPLLTDAKNDSFVKYHVKQGFVLFAIGALIWFVLSFIFGGMVSIFFFSPFLILYPLLQLGYVVLVVLGIVHAAQGKEEPLPLIGHLAEKITFI